MLRSIDIIGGITGAIYDYMIHGEHIIGACGGTFSVVQFSGSTCDFRVSLYSSSCWLDGLVLTTGRRMTGIEEDEW